MKPEVNQPPESHVFAELAQPRWMHEVADRGPLHRFAVQLQRRRVSRAALSYVLIMWLNVQIGDVLFPMFGLPDWILRLIVMVACMGFPVILILAWILQITPQGIVLDAGAANQPGEKPVRDMDIAVNVAFLLLGLALAALLVTDLAFAAPNDSSGATHQGPIIAPGQVLATSVSFESAGGLPGSEAFVVGVEAELRHRLIEMQDVVVISTPEPANAFDRPAARYALAGTVSVDASRVHVLAQLLDVTAGRYVWTTGFDLPNLTPLATSEAAAARIASGIRHLLGEVPAIAQPAVASAQSLEGRVDR